MLADKERTAPIELDVFLWEAPAPPSADAAGYVVYSEAACPDGTNHTYVFASNTRMAMERHVLQQVLKGVTTREREWELPGRVCSSATAQGDNCHTYVYIGLCETPFVVFLNASITGTPTVTNAAVRC